MQLTTNKRNALPNSAFAGPGRSYPVNDRSHAVNALARASQQVKAGYLSPAAEDKINTKAHAVLSRGAVHALANGGRVAYGDGDWREQVVTGKRHKIAHMADGGIVPEPSVGGFIKDRAKAAVDALRSKPKQPAATPAPVSNAVTEAVQNNYGLTGQATQATKSYNQKMSDAIDGYADGGVVITNDTFKPIRINQPVAHVQNKPQPSVNSAPAINVVQSAPTSAPQLAAQVNATPNAKLDDIVIPERKTLFGHAASILAGAGYANGGAVKDLRSGGKITGPGTGTSDDVPVLTSKGPIMGSNGEYVLPADTVKAVGESNLDALKNATHTPTGRPPLKMMPRGAAQALASAPVRARADGGLLPWEKDDAVKLPGGQFESKPAPSAADSAYENAQNVMDRSDTPFKNGGSNPGNQTADSATAPPSPTALPVSQPTENTQADSINSAGGAVDRLASTGWDELPDEGKFNPLPLYGDDGKGYLRNYQTGNTTVFSRQQSPSGAVQQLAQPAQPAEMASASNEPDWMKDAHKGVGEMRYAMAMNSLASGLSQRNISALAEQRQQGTANALDENTRTMTEGNRFGNQEKSFAVQQLARTNALQDQIANMPEGNARQNAIDQLDTLTGKSKWIEGRPTHVYNDMGQIVGENTNILNARTGQPNQVSNQPAKPVIPAGVAVGAKTAHPDGIFSLPDGRRATIKNGVIASIQ